MKKAALLFFCAIIMPSVMFFSLFAMLSILTLNTKGLVSHQKQLCLQEFTRNTGASIVCLQETNLKEDSSLIHQLNSHFFINSPVQPQSGVAIALCDTLYQDTEIIAHQNLIPGYLQALHFKLKQNEYHIVNLYMPQVFANAQKLVDKLNRYLKKIDEKSILVLAGDWNATLHDIDRLNSVEIRTQLVCELRTLITENNLEDVWRNFNPNKKQFTFKSLLKNSPMSRLDRIYLMKKDLHLASYINIIPSFSDHSAVFLSLQAPTSKYQSPYWKFDPSLLSSKEYQDIAKNIICYFTEKSEREECDINTLWDRFKEEVKFASQRFIKKIRAEEKEELSILLSHLKHLELTQLSPEDAKILLSIEHEVANLYKNRASEKLKTLQTQQAKEANTQSKFFLRLAKQSKPSSIISQLEINGQITSDRSKIFQNVFEEYKQTFSNEGNNPINPSSPLYEGLPKLSVEDKEYCEQPITKEEILESIQKAQLNRAPGFDGIPIEFYKFFWSEIQKLMIKLFINFQETSQLPNSMKKVIISPIPKPGDRNKLSNWRPISLLNTDYKILSRIYSKRISNVSASLLKSDQSYCIPGKTIYDNLHTLRNIIRDSNRRNTPLGILALDQQGAFNRVSHEYIEYLLNLHGFGPKLSQAISSLLKSMQGHVKIGSSLLPPFPFLIGVRQGDPIAGPLYVISIEPFLRSTMKENLINGYNIPGTSIQITNTAFADDVHLFVTKEEDFKTIPEIFQEYSSQSGAILNRTKCSGLFTGKWKTRTDAPLECKWSSEGIKCLGLHLGNTNNYEEKNWTSLITKVNGTLNNWSRFVKLTSYHGRRIICNQLIGSQLVHVLTILHPPQEFVDTIHKLLINFIWQGKHWLHPNYVFAPPEMGGIGLSHLQARINTIRLILASNLLEKQNSQDPSSAFHQYKMSYYGNIEHSHFFSKEKQIADMKNLDPFYHSLLSAWYSLNPILINEKFSLPFIKKTPLFGTQLIKAEDLAVIEEWKNLEYKTIGDLMETNGQWKTINFSTSSICVNRRLTFNFNGIKIYFNKKISNQEEDVLKFKFKSHDYNYKVFPNSRKILYQTSLQNYLQKPQVTGQANIINKKIEWKSLYTYPAEKKDGDVSWRLLHNALVTPKKFCQWQIVNSQQCPWCDEEGNVIHMVYKCKQVSNLWKYVSHKIQIINKCEPLTLDQAIMGFPPHSNERRLSNYLLILARSTIYRTYMNLIKEQLPATPHYLLIYKKRLQFRIKLEEHQAKTNQDKASIKTHFLINDALKTI